MTDRSTVTASANRSPGLVMLTLAGTLDSSTYREVRDLVIKAALDEPDAVLVDVDALAVPALTAWAVFTSARWHVSTWPDVPVILVCDNETARADIKRSGVTRYVPVFPDTTTAAAASAGTTARLRRRARAELPAAASSLRVGREFVSQWLTTWGRTEMILTASTVATVLMENVLEHTSSCPVLQVEAAGDAVTVAVSDGDPRPAARQEHPGSGAHPVSGLAIVAVLSRAWGCNPTPGAKTVWAVLGPESRI